MAKRNLKKCLTLLIIREIKIKTTMRYHLTPARIAIIKKCTHNKCQIGCGEKVTLLHCWWELVQSLWRTVWRFLKKQSYHIYDPAIPLLGIYPEKNMILKDTCTPMFTAALFTTAKTQKEPKCPLREE